MENEPGQAHCPTCTCHGLADPDADTVGQMHRFARDTEHEAAWDVMPRSGTQRRTVLDAIASAGDDGMTDVDVAAWTGLHFQSSQPRRYELMKGGWVVDSGQRRRTGKGGTAIVWVLTVKGRQQLQSELLPA